MRTASLALLLAASLALLLAASLAAAQAPSTSKGTMSIDLSLTDDNGIDAVTEIITLKNIRASEIEPFIRARLSRYGAVQVNDALNMLLVTDKQPKLRDLSGIVRTLDAAGVSDFLRLETEAIRLQYVQPSVVRPYLAKRLSGEGTIEANDTLNLLIITDLRSRIEAIKRLLPQFDIMPRQVAVEFKVFDITKLATSETGFDWFDIARNIPANYNYGTHSGDSRSHSSSDYQNQPGSASSTDQRYETQDRHIDRSFNAYVNANQLLQYLEQTSSANRTTVVSNPVVLVQNRASGRITSAVSYPTGQYNSSVMTVSVLPNISAASTVDLKVSLQFTANERTMSDNVLASELTAIASQPIIIGKILQTLDRSQRKGIPGLKDVPVLGYLFGRNTIVSEQHQLLVFAIPHIVEPGQGIADTTQIRGSE